MEESGSRKEKLLPQSSRPNLPSFNECNRLAFHDERTRFSRGKKIEEKWFLEERRGLHPAHGWLRRVYSRRCVPRDVRVVDSRLGFLYRGEGSACFDARSLQGGREKVLTLDGMSRRCEGKLKFREVA